MAAPRATAHRAGLMVVVSWEARKQAVKIRQAAGRYAFVLPLITAAVLTVLQKYGQDTLRPVTIKQLLDA